MSRDPYSLCPCGSGKKLKFCCQDILPEMIRIEKLIDNQPSAAERLLDELLAKYDDKVFLVTHKASLLMARRENHAARDILASFLKRVPDEPLALLALADICLITDGFADCKRIIHRAFQLVGRNFPSGVASLANRIAATMEVEKEMLSVREHLSLAARMLVDDARGQVLMKLAYFESKRQTPYPLRGRFAILPIELEDESLQKEENRARLVSQIGCWEPAAIIYSRLVKELPDHAGLWHNLGLFKAWDGRSTDAIVALKKSAELSDVYEEQMETEALAQLLEHEKSESCYSVADVWLSVSSVSDAVAQMTSSSRFGVVQFQEREEGKEQPVLLLEFLAEDVSDDLSTENLPDVIADVSVFEREDGGVIELIGTSDELEEAIEGVKTVLGELVTSQEGPNVFNRISDTCRPFDWKVHHPRQVSNSAIRKLDQARLEERLDDWLSTPLASLDHHAPKDALQAGVSAYKLDAAVLVLDAMSNRMSQSIDLKELRERLKLPKLTPLNPEEDRVLTGLPLMQFHRLDPSSITDEQAIEFANRISLIGHQQLLQVATSELVKRPEALKEFGAIRAFMLQATAAREELDTELVAKCFDEARASIGNSPDAFRTELELNIRELSFRLDDPEDPYLPILLVKIREQYFHKIPEIMDVIMDELKSSGCEHLMDLSSQTSIDVWTPEKEAAGAAASEESKLWIPGQD